MWREYTTGRASIIFLEENTSFSMSGAGDRQPSCAEDAIAFAGVGNSHLLGLLGSLVTLEKPRIGRSKDAALGLRRRAAVMQHILA